MDWESPFAFDHYFRCLISFSSSLYPENTSRRGTIFVEASFTEAYELHVDAYLSIHSAVVGESNGC